MTAVDERELMPRDQPAQVTGRLGRAEVTALRECRQDIALKRALPFGITPRERSKVAYPVRVVRDVDEDINDLTFR